MFYKKYLEKLIAKTYKMNKLEIENQCDLNFKQHENLKKLIDANDENCKKHWENQKNLINELREKHNMLIEAFNEQRVIIAKLTAKITKKAVKTTKKGK